MAIGISIAVVIFLEKKGGKRLINCVNMKKDAFSSFNDFVWKIFQKIFAFWLYYRSLIGFSLKVFALFVLFYQLNR